MYKLNSKKYRITFLAITIFTFFAFYGAIGYADTFTGDVSRSTNGLGDFIGEFTYRLFSPTAAELDVTLKNTSPSSNGGFLTGFVFNNPNNFITNVSLTGSNSLFKLLGRPIFQDTISASPFGRYDIGAALGGDFLGGSSPAKGIGVGETASFGFTLTGNNLDQLDTSSFIQARSNEGEFFVTRFRGFNDGGSDKVPGGVAAVPEPNVFLLLLFGLAGIASYKKKITKLCNVKMPANKIS